MYVLKWLNYTISLIVIVLFIGSYMYKFKSTNPGIVIILNGPSSVGKSSIIKAFQSKENRPWLGIGIDNFFIGILPPKFYLENKPEYYSIMQGIASEDDNGKIFKLNIGPDGQKIIKGMHRAIAAYANTGNNIIVDYIKYEDAWIDDFKKSLHGIKVIWVGVTASLETIQKREKKRGTSPEGHARSIYHRVHQDITYDLILDTNILSPERSANKVITHPHSGWLDGL